MQTQCQSLRPTTRDEHNQRGGGVGANKLPHADATDRRRVRQHADPLPITTGQLRWGQPREIRTISTSTLTRRVHAHGRMTKIVMPRMNQNSWLPIRCPPPTRHVRVCGSYVSPRTTKIQVAARPSLNHVRTIIDWEQVTHTIRRSDDSAQMCWEFRISKLKTKASRRTSEIYVLPR